MTATHLHPIRQRAGECACDYSCCVAPDVHMRQQKLIQRNARIRVYVCFHCWSKCEHVSDGILTTEERHG